jgi:glyoxylase-like metal-dependent hydrolase (beta-lactamase superfamily II)
MVEIHQHVSSPEGADVNAYLVEGARGVVAVDSTLTVSDSRALRARLDALGKPLLAVLVTHAHPDHYGGLVELTAGLDVPIIATERVGRVIRRDDEAKEQILRPMFGAEWPATRVFPNTTVQDGEHVRFEDLPFTVIDLGPGESPADSVWLLGDERIDVFAADQVYDHKHGYLADGFFEAWLSNIARLRDELAPDARLLVGHGGPVRRADFDWQVGYIETFVGAVRGADWSDPAAARSQVIDAVTTYLPVDDLRFLVELSIEPVAAQLGLLDHVS